MSYSTIKSISKQIRGVSYKPKDVSDKPQEGYIRLLRANNITENGVKLDDVVYVNSKCVSDQQILKVGDILIAASSGSISIVGKAVLIEDDINSTFGAFCKVIRLVSNVHYKYIGYYFRSAEYRRIISHLAAGANINNLRNENLDNLEIPLPPLATQKRIAEILDAADALRRKDQELLKKYDELAQAIFIDMFGDPVKNEKGWEVRKLGSVANMKAGSFISASEIKIEMEESFYPCFGGNGLRGFVKSFTHDGKYILIGRQGALCGNIKITEGKFHATEHAIVCSPKIEYNVLWFYFLLDLLNLNKYASGAAQPGLNVGTLVDIDLIYAPIEVQNQFAKKLELVDRQNIASRVKLNYTQDLFNTLIQKAFKGELVK